MPSSPETSEGIGSFWFPFYTASVYPQFHEQPPLGFGLQAAAFAVFGDHLAVERVYSLVMGCLTAVLIVAIWRTTIRDTAHDWLPIVFWLIPSTVTWSIVNNMLENTQTVFTTAAVLVFVYSLRGSRVAWASSVIGGALVLAAVLIKGPNGLFPLAAPVIAILALPLVEPLQNHFGGRRSVVTAVGVVGVVLFLLAGVISLLRIQVEPRDVQWIAEYRSLGPSLPAGATLGTCDAVSNDWGLHAYMQRLFRVSLDPRTDQHRRYYLQVTDRACEAPPSCRRIAATARMNLLDCSSSQHGDAR